MDQKHGIRARRRWRRLHTAVDARSGEILANDLTSDKIGDVTAVPGLLDQVDHPVSAVTADGASNTQSVYEAIADRHPEATAISNKDKKNRRDRHIDIIAEHGRRGWQQRSDYERQSLVETAMFRYKTIIGWRLHALTLFQQQTEVKIA